MALNDIYNWFRDKSTYFKSNSATWKVVLVAVDHDNNVRRIVMIRCSMFRTPSATTSPCTSTSSGCRRPRVGSGSQTARCVHIIIYNQCLLIILSMVMVMDIRSFTSGSSKDGGEGQKRAGSPRPPAPAAPVPDPGSGETLVKLVIGFFKYFSSMQIWWFIVFCQVSGGSSLHGHRGTSRPRLARRPLCPQIKLFIDIIY